MKKFGKIAVLLAAVCTVLCMAIGCGSNLNGSYTMKETVDVPYGDEVLHMPYYYELTLDGDNYDMILCVDIGGGFTQCVGWSGKCEIDGNKVVCKKGDKMYQYQATMEDGKPNIDKTTKEENEMPAGGSAMIDEATYTVDKAAGTFTRVESK